MNKPGIIFCLLSASLVNGDTIFPIEKSGTRKCLGAVVNAITERNNRIDISILTTAHCVYGVRKSELKVGQNGVVDKVFVHPYYDPSNVDYDIAIIKVLLETTEEIKTWTLENRKPDPKKKLKINLGEKGTVDALPVDLKSCQAKLGNRIRLSGKMMCASAKEGIVEDGSLLVKKEGDKIVGIAFYAGKPTVFTDTTNSEIYSFIKKYY